MNSEQNNLNNQGYNPMTNNQILNQQQANQQSLPSFEQPINTYENVNVNNQSLNKPPKKKKIGLIIGIIVALIIIIVGIIFCSKLLSTSSNGNANNNDNSNENTQNDNVYDKLTFTLEYNYMGLTFYYPNDLATVKNNNTGYVFEKREPNFYGGGYIIKQSQDDAYYMVAISNPLGYMWDDEIKQENITLDNIVEKSKEGLLNSFWNYTILMGEELGNHVYREDFDQIITEKEKISINGIDMFKVKGYFLDTKYNLIGKEDFIAYYMIGEKKDTDGNSINVPVYYLGFAIGSQYNELELYMNESIKYVKKN